MKPGALILGITVSVLLLAAAGWLYTMADDRGEGHYRSSIGLIREIQELSSNWSIEIARVRTDPLADFDILTSFAPQMSRLKERLSDAARPRRNASNASRPPTRWCATPPATCRSRRRT